MKKIILFFSTIFLIALSYGQTTIWEEDFEAATMPDGWEQYNDGTSSGTHEWTFGSGDMPIGGDFSTNAAIFDDDAAGDTGLHDRRWLRRTVGIDASAFTNLTIGYEYALQVNVNDGKLIVVIEYTETSGYGVIAEYIVDQDPIYVEVDLEPLIAALPIDRADIRIGFIFDDETSAWGWGAGIGTVNIKGDITNDFCLNRIPVEVKPIGAGCTTTMIASNVGATDSSPTNGTPSCGAHAGGDVWFSFIAPSSGGVKVIVPQVGEWSSFAHAIYTGNCGTTTELGCEVNFDINNIANIPSETVYSGLTAGTEYFFRTWDFGNNNFGVVHFCLEELDTSGIADAIVEGFKMYPNPVENTLHLSAVNTIDALSVYNMLGQEVLQSTPSTTEVALDMSSLPTGTYIVKVQAGEQIGSYSLIKE